MNRSTFPPFENQRGFVLPMVMFGLVIMTTLAVVAMLNSSDELLSSRAMRTSSAAFYAAEAGLHETYAKWDSYSGIDSIAPGDSLDLGWQTLANGASYRAVVHRWDAGDSPAYQVQVEGRSAGSAAAQKTLSFSLTTAAGMGYMLGECCAATATLKGSFRQRGKDGGTVLHSGFDTHPPGWEDAGVCADTLIDKPGMIMADTSSDFLELDAGATLLGDPPLVQDAAITDSVFDIFGEHTWDEVKAKADIIVDTTGYAYLADGSNPALVEASPGSPPELGIEDDEVYPRYNDDGTCDTTHPLNWGSDDPDDACFDYFPVILLRGEIDVRGGPNYGGDRFYGQGIFILDFDTVAGTGSEFEIEHEANLRGVILGKGCVAVQFGARFYGSIFLDATYDGVTCDNGADLHEDCRALDDCDQQTEVHWSQCAVDRAISRSGLAEYAEPTNPGGAQMLVSRSFGELF